MIHIFDKGLTSRSHTNQLKKKSNNPIKTWAKDLKSTSQIANKHGKLLNLRRQGNNKLTYKEIPSHTTNG